MHSELFDIQCRKQCTVYARQHSTFDHGPLHTDLFRNSFTLRIQYAIIGEILFILQNHSHQINYFGTYIISKAQISTITYKLRN